LYGSKTWRLTENNKRRDEATEMDALRRYSRISRKERIRNVTIRQQIVLEETIVKEIEQNQLTWYGHVQKLVERRNDINSIRKFLKVSSVDRLWCSPYFEYCWSETMSCT
jgi:hypothetical protein